MNKDTLSEKISLWLDNELSPAEATQLQARLESDPATRQTFEAMQQADQLLRLAATQLATPDPGFTQRFENRLAQYKAIKPWQIWLAMGALLAGTLLLFSAWALVSGVALLGVSTAMLDAGLIYQWLITFIDSANNLRGLAKLGILFLKASFIIMQEPLFWGCLLIALSLMGVWLWILGRLFRHKIITLSLLTL